MYTLLTTIILTTAHKSFKHHFNITDLIIESFKDHLNKFIICGDFDFPSEK